MLVDYPEMEVEAWINSEGEQLPTYQLRDFGMDVEIFEYVTQHLNFLGC
jgi:hypothetical protein